MAAMEIVGIRSTEDTLSQSPGENGASDQVPHRVHEADHELVFWFTPAKRIGHEQADQKEQQPPAAASQRVEPERPEERDHHRFEQTSRNGAAAIRPDEIPPSAGRIAAISQRRGHHEPHRDRQPREHEPRERHFVPRASGGTYPGPRHTPPRPAAGSFPWARNSLPFPNTEATP